MVHYRACKTNHPMCDCLDCIYNMRLLQRQSHQEVQYPHIHNSMQMRGTGIMDIKLLCQVFGTETVIKAISEMPDIQYPNLNDMVTANRMTNDITDCQINEASRQPTHDMDILQWHNHTQHSHAIEQLRAGRSDNEMMCLQTELLSTAYNAKAERSLWNKIKRWFKCHS